MKKAHLSIVLLSLLIVSCTTTRVAHLTNTNDKLQVFVNTLPDKPFTEIAYLQCDGSLVNTPQQLLNGLKKKAEIINADAIINVKYDFQGIWPIASAIAIKYK